MRAKTHVNEHAIRASQIHPSDKWVRIMRLCLQRKLEDLDKEARHIERERTRIKELIQTLPSSHHHVIKET